MCMCVCLFLSTTNKQTRTVAVGLSLFLARGLGQEGREEVRQRAGNRASGGRCGGRGCCTRRVREFFSPPALIFAAAAGERPCALCLCLLSRGWNRTSSESGAALAAPSRRIRTVWAVRQPPKTVVVKAEGLSLKRAPPPPPFAWLPRRSHAPLPAPFLVWDCC